jgi:hypothetical protein
MELIGLAELDIQFLEAMYIYTYTHTHTHTNTHTHIAVGLSNLWMSAYKLQLTYSSFFCLAMFSFLLLVFSALIRLTMH